MRNKKSTLPYRTISLPNNIYKDTEEHVKEHSKYVSIANFVRQAIRDKISKDSLEENDWYKKMKERETLKKMSIGPKLQNLQNQVIELQKEVIELQKDKLSKK